MAESSGANVCAGTLKKVSFPDSEGEHSHEYSVDLLSNQVYLAWSRPCVRSRRSSLSFTFIFVYSNQVVQHVVKRRHHPDSVEPECETNCFYDCAHRVVTTENGPMDGEVRNCRLPDDARPELERIACGCGRDPSPHLAIPLADV